MKPYFWYFIVSSLVFTASSTCLLYANPTQCAQCSPGFYLNTNFICNICPLNCAQCYAINYCIACQPGAYMNNTVCVSCGKNCFNCNNNGVCQQCVIGYYLNSSNSCLPCVNYCSNCSSANTCTTCALGFGFNSSSTQCYVCSGVCNQCQFNITSGLSECITCPNSFYLNNNVSCLACPALCSTCSANSGICTLCYYGYFLNGENICTPCTSNCQNCTTQTFCLSCYTSFYLNIIDSQTQTCQACPNECASCTSSGCSTCIRGYYFNSSSQCQICGQACSSCTGPNSCTACSGSYYVNNGQCSQCMELCSTCSTGSTCQTCSSTNYAVVNLQCVLCSTVQEGCQTCSTQFICLTCESGYYLLENACYNLYEGLSAGWIVFIVFSSLAVVVGTGYAIWAYWKRRRGFMGPLGGGNQNNGLRGTYYEVP